jgi:RHS repeat-associated protein
MVSEAFGKTFVDATLAPTTTGTTTNNFRFPGQYEDPETGTHYNYMRTYLPFAGRYGETDPIGIMGGLNSYLYAFANSFVFTDPFGLDNCTGATISTTGFSEVPGCTANFIGQGFENASVFGKARPVGHRRNTSGPIATNIGPNSEDPMPSAEALITRSPNRLIKPGMKLDIVMADWHIEWVQTIERTVTTTPTSWQCVLYMCRRTKDCRVDTSQYKIKFVTVGVATTSIQRDEDKGRTSLGRHPIDHFFPPAKFK